MDYKLDSGVLNMTTKCTDDFSCLSSDDRCLCKAERYLGGEDGVLFIRPKDNIRNCSYRMSFGSSYVCNCPTRKGIYLRYYI